MALADKRNMQFTMKEKDTEKHTHQKYDKVTKELLDRNDILAALLNMIGCFRQYTIRPEDIVNMPTEEMIYESGMKLSVFRDKLKCCTVRMTDRTVRVMIGIENQKEIDGEMVIRCFAYDAGDYLRQLREDKHIYAVMTIVLNWSEKQWADTRSLLDHAGLPEELREWFTDSRLNVIDMRYFEEEEIEKAEVRDLKDVMRIARLSRNRDAFMSYVEAHPDWSVTESTADLCNTLFDTGFSVPEGGEINMCTAIREIKEMAVQQGIQQGVQQGIQQERKEQARLREQERKELREKNILYCFTSFKQLAPGLSDESIIRKLADDYHMTMDEVRKLVYTRT